MPINRNRFTSFLILSLLLLLLYQIQELLLDFNHISDEERESHEAIPLISVQRLKQRPRRFKKFTLFEPTVFENVIIQHMAPWVELPRNFYLLNGNPYDCPIDFNDYPNTRSSALSTEDRILRFILMLRGVKSFVIEELFDQDYSVAYRDFIHCCRACMYGLGPIYLTPLEPGTPECDELVGNNNFRHFGNVIYAADVTKVQHEFRFVCLFVVFLDGIARCRSFNSCLFLPTLFVLDFCFHGCERYLFIVQQNFKKIITMVITKCTMLVFLHFVIV